MRKLIIFFTILSFYCCKPEITENQVLIDFEWKDVLKNTFLLAKGNIPYVYREFNNIELKDTIASIYYNCSDLGYEVNDSILNYIINRNNRKITNKLDEMLNIVFINDTSNFDENYIIYSEPFYVSKEIICISMSNKIVKENILEHWVFFLKKQNDSFKILEYYDVRKNKFFKSIPLN